MVKLLINEKLDVNSFDMNENTALHNAVSCDNDKQEDVQHRIACIEDLIDAKADVDALNIRRETPLHNASRYGSRKLVKCLLKHNADLLVANVDGLNCLEVAVDEKNEDVVKYFIDEHDQIFDLMRNAHFPNESSRNIITPMRKLIEKMPDMAFLTLEKCTIEIGAEMTSLHQKVYNYEFLDDEYFSSSWEKGKKKI
jgi:transient receptor potential cation channel subfamily A protein 1